MEFRGIGRQDSHDPRYQSATLENLQHEKAIEDEIFRATLAETQRLASRGRGQRRARGRGRGRGRGEHAYPEAHHQEPTYQAEYASHQAAEYSYQPQHTYAQQQPQYAQEFTQSPRTAEPQPVSYTAAVVHQPLQNRGYSTQVLKTGQYGQQVHHQSASGYPARIVRSTNYAPVRTPIQQSSPQMPVLPAQTTVEPIMIGMSQLQVSPNHQQQYRTATRTAAYHTYPQSQHPPETYNSHQSPYRYTDFPTASPPQFSGSVQQYQQHPAPHQADSYHNQYEKPAYHSTPYISSSQAPSAAKPSNPYKRMTLCKYWNSSVGCKYGDNCHFVHQIDPNMNSDFAICWDFNTKRGCHNPNCRWEHRPCKVSRSHPTEVGVMCDPKYGIENSKQVSKTEAVPFSIFSRAKKKQVSTDL